MNRKPDNSVMTAKELFDYLVKSLRSGAIKPEHKVIIHGPTGRAGLKKVSGKFEGKEEVFNAPGSLIISFSN